MNTLLLQSKFERLPEHLKKQVLDYIEFLMSREEKVIPRQDVEKPTRIKPGFGGAKGMFVMAPDFDEPLEDLKAYPISILW
jgi:hypothetical protein